MAVLSGALRLATPLALAALGELIVQRAGLVNLGIDGIMLCGCLAGVLGSAVGGWALGLLAGATVGGSLGALLAVIVLVGEADVIIAGIGIGVLGYGAADFDAQLWQRRIPAVALTLAPDARLPFTLPQVLLDALTQNVVTWGTVGMALAIGAILRHGRAGPVLEAIGRDPDSARLRGVGVRRWQAAALMTGGTLAGIAGAALTVAYVGAFTSGMTAGRGFVAIAVVILTRGRPLRTCLACLAFGALESAGLQLQGGTSASMVALTTVLPYLVTLAALAATKARLKRPA